MTMEAEFDSVNFKGSILAAPIDYGALAEVLGEFLQANGFQLRIVYEEDLAALRLRVGPEQLRAIEDLEDRMIIAICRTSDEMPAAVELLQLVIDDEVVAPTST